MVTHCCLTHITHTLTHKESIMTNSLDRAQRLSITAAAINYKLKHSKKNWKALLEAIEATAQDNHAYEPTTTVYGYTVKVIDNTATIVNGGRFSYTTAVTLCRMINSHAAEGTELIHFEPCLGRATFSVFDLDGNDIMVRTYTVDPDGSVTDTTLANPSVPVVDGYNRTVSITNHDGIAVVVGYGRSYSLATAITLCRMINATLDADTTLTSLTISPSMVDVEYTDNAGLAIYKEYTVDPDGYVALATYQENAALPAA